MLLCVSLVHGLIIPVGVRATGASKIYNSSEFSLTMQNMDAFEEQPLVIKYGEGMLTTGQMKYYGTAVEDMRFQVDETGYYTIYVRAQDRTEFVTYIYVEG